MEPNENHPDFVSDATVDVACSAESKSRRLPTVYEVCDDVHRMISLRDEAADVGLNSSRIQTTKREDDKREGSCY